MSKWEGGLYAQECDVGDTSLHNIHKYATVGPGGILYSSVMPAHISGLLRWMDTRPGMHELGISPRVSSHILGVMKMPYVQRVTIDSSLQTPSTESDLRRAIAIINNHLANGRNIHECQEEMIEAGLKEYARL